MKKGKGMRGKGMNWKGGSSRLQFTKNAIRHGKILSFFPNEKERKLCKKKKRRGKGKGGGYLTLFKGIINSLSSLIFILTCSLIYVLFFKQLVV